MNKRLTPVRSEHWLFWIVLVCALMTLPISFVYEKGGRVLFYFCSYISVIGILVSLKKYNATFLKCRSALPLFFLGIVFISWSVYSDYKSNLSDELLYTAGKRCLLAFIITTYIIGMLKSATINLNILKKMAMASIILAFLMSSFYACYQVLVTTDPEHLRITLGINRATLTAYAYSALSIALMSLILELKKESLRKTIFFITAIISLYVIILTQTRSAIVIHVLMIACLTYRTFFTSRNIKFLSLLFVALLFCATLSYKVIETRLLSTIQEVSLYNKGDDNSSLGSRFTMWKTGLISFKHAPLGQSLEDRNSFIKKYLYEHNQPNSSALEYINVHLHNELIQYASIFGVFGVLALLYFYWENIITLSRGKNTLQPASLVTLSTLLYGSTDVLMTSVEYIIIYSILIVMLFIISFEKQHH